MMGKKRRKSISGRSKRYYLSREEANVLPLNVLAKGHLKKYNLFNL